MKTTSLIVEILVVGVLGALVLLPISAQLGGAELSDAFQAVGRLQLVAQLALAYALGVMWNRLCNGLFSGPERLVRSKLGITKSENQESRIRLSSTTNPLNDYLVATRGIIRVSRASCVLLLSYLLLGLFRVPAIAFSNERVLHPPLFMTTLLLFLGVYSWWRLYRGYLLTIKDAVSTSRSLRETGGQ